MMFGRGLLRTCVAVSLTTLCLAGALDVARAVDVTVTVTGGIDSSTTEGVAMSASSEGYACVDLGSGTEMDENPTGACVGTTAPIPPSRDARAFFPPGPGYTDMGYAYSTDTYFSTPPGSKWYHVAVLDSCGELDSCRSEALFKDPWVFSHAGGEAFSVTLHRSFFGDPELFGIVGDGGGGTLVTASYHSETSSDVSGFLFSVDLSYEFDQPLSVDVTVGGFLTGSPGWDEGVLEGLLSAALDAGTPDNVFELLEDFDFPSIEIDVVAGSTLEIQTADLAVASIERPTSMLEDASWGVIKTIYR